MFIFNYITTNIITGKQYVGMHVCEKINDGYLGTGKLILQTLRKYGREKFKREILCFCDSVAEANFNEMIFIEQYKTLFPNGYNLSPTGGLGYSGCFSESIREKMLGNKNAQGKVPSKETREKIRISKIGNTWGFKKGHKINVGRKISEKVRLNLINVNTNRTYGKVSDDTKMKMSLARKSKPSLRKGKPLSEEIKEKIRQTKKIKHGSTWLGKKHSEETRRKMSEVRIGMKYNKQYKQEVA